MQHTCMKNSNRQRDRLCSLLYRYIDVIRDEKIYQTPFPCMVHPSVHFKKISVTRYYLFLDPAGKKSAGNIQEGGRIMTLSMHLARRIEDCQREQSKPEYMIHAS